MLFAHIHVGRPGTNGGVAAFLCGGGDKPACPLSGTTPERAGGAVEPPLLVPCGAWYVVALRRSAPPAVAPRRRADPRSMRRCP